ncbi:hypothetical protein GC102_15945 [Paenibacillus sp. LMG 31460]|uniref:Uncharacterized protein n=1 Tax=Paenibacillus germinis TaxID=2654979 RepID=A0ABX1Z1J3_9BACL|nr:hypothetical protein [Paenibacillus germinis]
MTASSKEEHHYVVKTMFPKMGKIRGTEELISALKEKLDHCANEKR